MTSPRPRKATPRGAVTAVAGFMLADLVLTASAVRWALTTRYATVSPLGAVPMPGAPAAKHPGGTPIIAFATARAVPLRLEVPRLAIAADVQAVGVGQDGSLAVPDRVATVGWWRQGAAPGAAAGTVVIDGHVDSASQGRGALFLLSHARPGDGVIIATSTAQVRYTVVALRVYPKSQLPSELFTRVGSPRLVLITCGGRFDARTRHYSSNVVVYALPAPA